MIKSAVSPLTTCVLLGAVLAMFTLFAGRAEAANVLNNPGFETGNLGGWASYGPNTYVMNTPAVAHSGSYYFKIYQTFNTQTNYNGIYQNYVSGPGVTYTADGWAYTLSTDTLGGQNVAWLEVSFRDASGNILALYRSSLITTNAIATGAFPKNTWVDLPVTNQYNPNTYQITNTVSSLIAPPNTSYVQYQIVFQGDQYNSGGSMYFDDLDVKSNWRDIVWPKLECRLSDLTQQQFLNSFNNWTFESATDLNWRLHGFLVGATSRTERTHSTAPKTPIVPMVISILPP